MRYMVLIEQLILLNFEKMAYIFMIFLTLMRPGILTLVYPLSIFGFALLHEHRAPK